MESIKDNLYPKISGKAKNLIIEFAKYQRSSKTRRVQSISLTGTVKIHGTHGDILITANNDIQLLSRNDKVTPAVDSYGFLQFVGATRLSILALKQQIHARFLKLNPKAKILDDHPLIIAGEWIGPKIQKDVAVSALPIRYFVIISIRINGEWQPDELYSDIENKSACIVNVSRGGYFHETIRLKNPEPALAKMQALANAVEEECPFAKTFGIIGLGEGIVWKPAAPLCHDAKYWLKLKGPISMGTAVAGSAAQNPQRSNFIAPIFSSQISATNGSVSGKQIGNTVSPQRHLASKFQQSASTTAARTPSKVTGNTMSLHGLGLDQTPSTSITAPQAITEFADKRPESRTPVQNSSNSHTTPRLSQSGRTMPLSLKKVDVEKLENLRNIDRNRPVSLVSKKLSGAPSELTKTTEKGKFVRLTPEIIRLARLEILGLIESACPGSTSPAIEKATPAIEEDNKPARKKSSTTNKSDTNSSLLYNADIDQELWSDQDQDQEAWPNPAFAQRSEKAISEASYSSPSTPIPEKFQDDTFEDKKPSFPPLILHKVETPETVAAAEFTRLVVRERRLEQAWQYLGETGVPTDTKGVKTFLQWLWHDVAVEEKAEIEVMEINKALLKKEVCRVARDWYFEELAFEEHNDNFNTGARREEH